MISRMNTSSHKNTTKHTEIYFSMPVIHNEIFAECSTCKIYQKSMTVEPCYNFPNTLHISTVVEHRLSVYNQLRNDSARSHACPDKPVDECSIAFLAVK